MSYNLANAIPVVKSISGESSANPGVTFLLLPKWGKLGGFWEKNAAETIEMQQHAISVYSCRKNEK
jgi:hypothetical protein